MFSIVPSSSPFLDDRLFRNEKEKQEEIWVVVGGDAPGGRCLNASWGPSPIAGCRLLTVLTRNVTLLFVEHEEEADECVQTRSLGLHQSSFCTAWGILPGNPQ